MDCGISTETCRRVTRQLLVAALKRLRDAALAHAEVRPAVYAHVGARNATLNAMTQGMRIVLSGTAVSPPGGAADGAVARVRFHSMGILRSRGRCTMVCRHWHGALAVDKGELAVKDRASWAPHTTSYVTVLVLRRPWDGPRFVWDDKMQQGEVLLPDGSVPLRRSARGTTLDGPRLPIGTTTHPAGLCVTRSFKSRQKDVPCECITRSVTRALHQPAVEPTGGCYEEAVVVLGWRGWDEAAREARRETAAPTAAPAAAPAAAPDATPAAAPAAAPAVSSASASTAPAAAPREARREIIAVICFSPIHSLPGEELARLQRYAPEVVAQALRWHNSLQLQEASAMTVQYVLLPEATVRSDFRRRGTATILRCASSTVHSSVAGKGALFRRVGDAACSKEPERTRRLACAGVCTH